MRLLNVLRCSLESCFLAGRRKYTVGARAAIVASVAVAKRSSGELNLSSDISGFGVCMILGYCVGICCEEMVEKRPGNCMTILDSGHVSVNALRRIVRRCASNTGSPVMSTGLCRSQVLLCRFISCCMCE